MSTCPVYGSVVSVYVLATLHLQLHLFTRSCLRYTRDVFGTCCVRAGRIDMHARAADLILAFTKTARIRLSSNAILDKTRRRVEYSGRRVELTEAV